MRERRLAKDLQTDLGYYAAGTPVEVIRSPKPQHLIAITPAGPVELHKSMFRRDTPSVLGVAGPTRSPVERRLAISQTMLAELYLAAPTAVQRDVEEHLGEAKIAWMLSTHAQQMRRRAARAEANAC